MLCRPIAWRCGQYGGDFAAIGNRDGRNMGRVVGPILTQAGTPLGLPSRQHGFGRIYRPAGVGRLAAPAVGSAFMMLTGGIEAADGKS
jgi:hypothetical protein